MIELAPGLAALVFGVHSTAKLDEAVPTAVVVALAAPGEIVVVAVPTAVVPIVVAVSPLRNYGKLELVLTGCYLPLYLHKPEENTMGMNLKTYRY